MRGSGIATLLLATTILGAGVDSAAFAQPNIQGVDQPAARGSDGGELEELVVTARWREEKLQAVPIAINAVTGAALNEHTIADAVDPGKLAPALNTSETNRDLEGYEIRGMSNNNASAQGQSPAITPYFAEVPYPIGDGGGPGRFYDWIASRFSKDLEAPCSGATRPAARS